MSVEALRARERGRLRRAVAAVVAITALSALLLYKLPSNLAIGIGGIVVVPALLVWLWKAPVRGVYVLVAGAAVMEQYFSADIYADDLGRYVPFFQDVSSWTHIKGLSFSIAELLMLLMLLIWPLKAIAERTWRFDKGSLMRPLGLYMLMVLLGEIHGITSGGNTTLSLWEVRGQVYMFITYLLACNLVKTRKQADTVVWILVLGSGIKGIQGTWRYLITLHGHLGGIESIFPHEQAFFFNAFFTLTAIVFLYGGPRRLKRAALWLLPFVLIATIANQRRAAILALGIGLLGLLVVTAAVYLPRRRTALVILLALAVLLPPYVIAFGNKSGTIAGPARSIMSAFHPDPRDASSNLYRVNEDKDILATMATSPIIGYGFGKLMLTPYHLADIANFYLFWNLLPHDSILWVWMRLGTIGYVLLWFLIGTAIVQAAGLIRRLDDPYLKGLALWIVLLVLQEIVFGYLDLQWSNYRNPMTMGVLFALVSRLAMYARPEENGKRRANQRNRRDRKNTTAKTPSSLAVVDGRLRTEPAHLWSAKV